MTNNKILIVDDNPEIREVLNVLLSSEGYDVIEAKDGQEAIDMVSDDIDLYILDIMMPIINGYQACVEIRKKSNAPILFLTAKRFKKVTKHLIFLVVGMIIYQNHSLIMN